MRQIRFNHSLMLLMLRTGPNIFIVFTSRILRTKHKFFHRDLPVQRNSWNNNVTLNFTNKSLPCSCTWVLNHSNQQRVTALNARRLSTELVSYSWQFVQSAPVFSLRSRERQTLTICVDTCVRYSMHEAASNELLLTLFRREVLRGDVQRRLRL